MKYYITTPIYYVNAAPHIGHTYTTIAADTIKRMKRMEGYDAYLTTGTDEHGQKIERAAKAAGQTPEQFTDVISTEFRNQWKGLNLDVDYFQRTTSPQHAKVVQDLFSDAWRTATSRRVRTPVSIACSMNCTSTKPSRAIPVPIAAVRPRLSPKRTTSSSCRPFRTNCWPL